MHEATLHPPHLIDSSGTLTPAALIPVCAYQTNMTLLGQTRHNINFPVCTSFKPTVLGGQLCHSLNLNKLEAVKKSQSGITNGIFLIIDAECDINIQKGSSSPVGKFGLIKIEDVFNKENNPKIYMNTLASFTAYRSGEYALSGLKRITGTTNFLELSDDAKDCQIETFEECQLKRYMSEILKQCGCVPWALRNANTLKVHCILIFHTRLCCLGSLLLYSKRLPLLHISLPEGHLRLPGLLYWTLC